MTREESSASRPTGGKCGVVRVVLAATVPRVVDTQSQSDPVPGHRRVS
jgi:hypothetical protein